MAQYCDTKKLEKVWFNWLLAKATPCLDSYRKAGMLYTKTIGLVPDPENTSIPLVKNGKTFPDPVHPIRAHCILLRHPYFFTSFGGKVQEYASEIHAESNGNYNIEPKLIQDIDITKRENKLKKSAIPRQQIISMLENDGYILENDVTDNWNNLLTDINKICLGIATKFHQKTSEEMNDLANEALIQVLNKLVSNKLVYTPGRAPVFNLLTTTIHRCMFSIMNKRKNQKEGLNRLLHDAQAGTLPQTNRSLRLQTHTIKKHENR